MDAYGQTQFDQYPVSGPGGSFGGANQQVGLQDYDSYGSDLGGGDSFGSLRRSGEVVDLISHDKKLSRD